MKKLIFIAVLILSLGLVACGDTEKETVEVDYTTLNKENITNVVTNILGDKTDEDKNRVVSVEITDENYVHITLNANSELSAFPILQDTRELFEELSKFDTAEQMNVFWMGTAVDDKGNKSEIEIVKVGFVKETMDEINFENFPIESFQTYSFPYYIHPSWEFEF